MSLDDCPLLSNLPLSDEKRKLLNVPKVLSVGEPAVSLGVLAAIAC